MQRPTGDAATLLNEDWRAWPLAAKLAFLERLKERTDAVNVEFQAFQERYRFDPVAFVYDCIDLGKDEPADYQCEIMETLYRKGRAAVRSPHGAGKTALASWLILHFALTRDGRDWKLPTTATAWRQLTKFLWPEVRKWARKIRWEKIGRQPFDERRELMRLSLKLSTGEAFALASDNVAQIEGAHAQHLLYIFDEAKAIPDTMWDGAEGAFSSPDTAETLALAISTPGNPQGRFYEIHSRAEGLEDWWVRHITVDEAIKARRINVRWVESRRKHWGENSPVFQNRVLGEFATDSIDTVCSLTLVEAAVQRWYEWKDAGKILPLEMTSVGVDVSRSGGDVTVMALRYGDIITELRETKQKSLMDTTGRVSGILMAGGVAVVDVIGLGAGVVDRLEEVGDNVVPFVASGKSRQSDRSGEMQFLNSRAEAWWKFRERLEDGRVAIPPDDRLIGELTAPTWGVTSGRKYKVESKKEVAKRLGKSTNYADAVVQAYWIDGNEPVYLPALVVAREEMETWFGEGGGRGGMFEDWERFGTDRLFEAERRSSDW